MTDVPFHATRMGQRFYEQTVPELARQLSRLNANLERLIEAANPTETHHAHDEEEPDDVRRPDEEDPHPPHA